MKDAIADGTSARAAWSKPGIVVAVAIALEVALHLAAITHYGYFRDELYYLACADHLAFGYVDHPPLSIAVLALVRALFGASLVAVRFVPMLCGAALIAIAGSLVRTMKGGAFAAALACGATLFAPVILAFDHFFSMNALDGLAWALAAWLFVRVLEASSTKRWIALGVVLGLGLENKASVLWLGAGIGVALVAFRRDLLKTRGPWIAAAIAIALFVPNVLWQRANGWPTVEFAKNAMEQKYKEHSLGAFAGELASEMGFAAAPIYLAGIAAPFFPGFDRAARASRADLPSHALKPWRALACVPLVALVIVASSKAAKPEYLGASLPLAFACGGVAIDARLARWPRARWAALAPIAALGALAVPFVLPILPVDRFIAYQRAMGQAPESSEKKEIGPLPQLYADMFGWPTLIDAFAVADATLTPYEHAHAAVISRTGYGVAAAVEHFGPARGLPHGITGHNNFYLWGPRDFDGTAAIIAGGEQRWVEEHFASFTPVTSWDCDLCMPYERHKTIWVARGLKQPLAVFWKERRYFE